MALTFLDLYNTCAGQPWSMYDSDAESIDDLESALKISINKALSFIWNYQPWSFRYYAHIIRTKQNKTSYSLPNGTITRKVVNGKEKFGVKYNGKSLTYVDDEDELDAKEGEPESFYIKGENLYLYPVPDDTYLITIDYLLMPCALTADDEQIYELTEEDDKVNVPEKYEKPFRNCLISLAMIYAIADESDENHSGYMKQYEDSLAVLFKYCRDKVRNRRIII